MRSVFFLTLVGAVTTGFVACVGDDPEATPTTNVDAAPDSPSSPDDASADSAPLDASVPCAMDAPFTVEKVPELSTTSGDYGIALTPNGLAAYIGNPTIRVHQRSTVDSPFGAAVTLTGLPSGINVWPSIGPDPTEMFFSNAPANASAKLYRARLTPGGAADVALLSGPNDPDAGVSDDRPFIANEKALYFIRTINGQTYRIFRAERASASSAFGTAVEVNGLGNFKHEADPVVTSDEREIYFSTYDLDDAAVSTGAIRTVRATRSDPLLPFGTPIEVPELHVAGKRDRPMWLSPDRCTLYLISTREGADENSYDVFVATRKP